MFRSFTRTFLPNPLDRVLKKAAQRNAKTVLICWNRGLGDAALGVAAIIERIRKFIPEGKISLLVRESLKEGFSLLDGVEVLAAQGWQRGHFYDWRQSLPQRNFDLVLEKPSPSDWCRWQHNVFTPRLKWQSTYDDLWKSFDLPDGFTYIGVQAEAETNYGLWRNWSKERWEQLFDHLASLGYVRILLFGFAKMQSFKHPNIIDLRGQTTLLQLLSIIKNRCSAIVVPDSGILSMTYYLDVEFPIRVVSLWADPRHGILKQGVASPNLRLIHQPLIGKHRNLSTVDAESVFQALFPSKNDSPFCFATNSEKISPILMEKTVCILLAGGQGSRLGFLGPKGLFPILNKSLFQHLLEKIAPTMPVAIMTSPLNHEETVDFLHRHQNFGRNISFFIQETIPLLDEHYVPAGMGPAGNGSVYASFAASGLLDRLEQEGMENIMILPIENILADPMDGRLFAFHRQNKADVTIKCIPRRQGEAMGALGLENGKISIVEYIHLKSDPFWFSYIGQVLVSFLFFRKAASLSLPFHWVRKKNGGITVWKREKLLFDAFHAAGKVVALCYQRELCYAPIKDLESVPIAMQKLPSSNSGIGS